MVESLRRLGVGMEWNKPTATIALDGGWAVRSEHGCDGRGGEMLDLYVGNSGTTVRFLTAMLTVGTAISASTATRACASGRFEICSMPCGCSRRRDQRARNRLPAGDGASQRSNRREAVVRGDVSSQYLSALLMTAPYARQGVRLRVDGPLVSQPYVRMTLAVMRAFGVEVGESQSTAAYNVRPARYVGRAYTIEPDASAASYFFAAAAITGGSITVEGLSRASLQGDVAFVDLLEQMGCRVEHSPHAISVHGGPLRGITAEMNAISDTVQTLAAVALFAAGPTTITSVAHIRHKETDRIGNLAAELRKFGATVDELPDGLRITPGPFTRRDDRNYDDHRMAMSLSLVGLRVPGVVIKIRRACRRRIPASSTT